MRSNFGQTAQARFWGRKTQHCNYGDIPVVERCKGDTSDEGANYSRSVYRRILGFQEGKATLVRGPSLVDPPNGLFLLNPLHTMTQFLEHPSTSSLFFREYLHPFCLEWSINDCLALLQSPPPSVVETAKRFARRLSGVYNTDNPTTPSDKVDGATGFPNQPQYSHDMHDELLISLHEKWAALSIIFNYKFTHEPMLDTSKKMRGASFRRLLSRGNSIGKHLFVPKVACNRQGGVECRFERIPLDIRRYELLFSDVACFGSIGEDVVEGRRMALSNTFGFHEEDKFCTREDPIVETVNEIVSLSALVRWEGANNDRRQDQLGGYVEVVKSRGKALPGHAGIFEVEQVYRRRRGGRKSILRMA